VSSYGDYSTLSLYGDIVRVSLYDDTLALSLGDDNPENELGETSSLVQGAPRQPSRGASVWRRCHQKQLGARLGTGAPVQRLATGARRTQGVCWTRPQGNPAPTGAQLTSGNFTPVLAWQR
jgi:hypothetical protein